MKVQMLDESEEIPRDVASGGARIAIPMHVDMERKTT